MILSPLRYSAAAGNFHVSTYLLRQNHDTVILLKDQARRLYLKILTKFLFFYLFFRVAWIYSRVHRCRGCQKFGGSEIRTEREGSESVSMYHECFRGRVRIWFRDVGRSVFLIFLGGVGGRSSWNVGPSFRHPCNVLCPCNINMNGLHFYQLEFSNLNTVQQGFLLQFDDDGKGSW